MMTEIAFYLCGTLLLLVVARAISAPFERRRERREREEFERDLARLRRITEDSERSIRYAQGLTKAIMDGKCDEYIEKKIMEEKEEYDRKWREWYEKREK